MINGMTVARSNEIENSLVENLQPVTKATMKMKHDSQSDWRSRGGAADFLDVSPDTIERRAVPWQEEPVPGKIRYKLLRLGEDTRQERRYYRRDLEALLLIG